MTAITPELRQTIERLGHAELIDPDTNATYVVIPAERYRQLQPLLDTGGDEVNDMAPLLADLSPEDWEGASAWGL